MHIGFLFPHRGRHRIRAWILIAGAWLAAANAWSQPVDLEAVLQPYLHARTYCETGRHGQSPFGPGEPYTFCAEGSGQFRLVYGQQPNEKAAWGMGGGRVQTYAQVTGQQQSGTWNLLNSRYSYTAGASAAANSPLFGNARLGFAGTPTWGRFHQEDDAVPADGMVRFAFHWPNGGGVERLIVRRADNRVVRWETRYRDGGLDFVDVMSSSVDVPLTDADLTYRPPLWSSMSWQNAPMKFTALMAVLLVVVAGGVWWSAFTGARDVQHVVRLRRKLWNWTGGAVLATTAALAALAAAVQPIIIVWGLAILAATGFVAISVAIAASYPAEALAELTRRRTDQRT